MNQKLTVEIDSGWKWSRDIPPANGKGLPAAGRAAGRAGGPAGGRTLGEAP